MTTKEFKFLFLIIIACLVVFGISVSLQSTLAIWETPTGAPPGNNTAEPLNVSINPQLKIGNLYLDGLVGNTGSQFLINPGTLGVLGYESTERTRINADSFGTNDLGNGSIFIEGSAIDATTTLKIGAGIAASGYGYVNGVPRDIQLGSSTPQGLKGLYLDAESGAVGVAANTDGNPYSDIGFFVGTSTAFTGDYVYFKKYPGTGGIPANENYSPIIALLDENDEPGYIFKHNEGPLYIKNSDSGEAGQVGKGLIYLMPNNIEGNDAMLTLFATTSQMFLTGSGTSSKPMIIRTRALDPEGGDIDVDNTIVFGSKVGISTSTQNWQPKYEFVIRDTDDSDGGSDLYIWGNPQESWMSHPVNPELSLGNGGSGPNDYWSIYSDENVVGSKQLRFWRGGDVISIASTTISGESQINVGIGTTTASSTLTVIGNIAAEEYCDEFGRNCVDASGFTGGGSGYWAKDGTTLHPTDTNNSVLVGSDTANTSAIMEVAGGDFTVLGGSDVYLMTAAPLNHAGNNYDDDFEDPGNHDNAYILFDKASGSFGIRSCKVASEPCLVDNATGNNNFGVACVDVGGGALHVTMYFENDDFTGEADLTSWFNSLCGGCGPTVDYYEEGIWQNSGGGDYNWSGTKNVVSGYGFTSPPEFKQGKNSAFRVSNATGASNFSGNLYGLDTDNQLIWQGDVKFGNIANQVPAQNNALYVAESYNQNSGQVIGLGFTVNSMPSAPSMAGLFSIYGGIGTQGTQDFNGSIVAEYLQLRIGSEGYHNSLTGLKIEPTLAEEAVNSRNVGDYKGAIFSIGNESAAAATANYSNFVDISLESKSAPGITINNYKGINIADNSPYVAGSSYGIYNLDRTYLGKNVGIGSNDNPGYLLHLAKSTGMTAIANIQDDSILGDLWTGMRLEREQTVPDSEPEQWFMGMGDEDNNLLIRRNNSDNAFKVFNDDVSVGGSGVGAYQYCNLDGEDCFEAGDVTVGPGISLWSQNPADTDEIYYNKDNVGIGVTDPEYKLDIYNSGTPVTVHVDSGVWRALQLERNNHKFSFGLEYGIAGIQLYDEDNTKFVWYYDGNLRLLENGGNVGIGKTDPGYLLHLATTTGITAIANIQDESALGSLWTGMRLERDEAEPEQWFVGMGDNATYGNDLLVRRNNFDNAFKVFNNDPTATPGESGVGAQNYCNLAGDVCFEAGDVGGGSEYWEEDPSDPSNIYYKNLNGNIGIGITSPGYAVHVASDSGAAIMNIEDEIGNLWTGTRLERPVGADGQLERWFTGMNTSDNKLRFRGTNDGNPAVTGDYMVIDNNSGNVGIGTDSPGTKLHVSNLLGSTQIRITSKNDSASSIAFGDPENTDAGRILYQHSNDKMEFLTVDTSRMSIDQNGNIGIGATNPNSLLNLKHDSSGPIINIQGSNINNYKGTRIAGPANDELWFAGSNNEIKNLTYVNNYVIRRNNSEDVFKAFTTDESRVGANKYCDLAGTTCKSVGEMGGFWELDGADIININRATGNIKLGSDLITDRFSAQPDINHNTYIGEGVMGGVVLPGDDGAKNNTALGYQTMYSTLQAHGNVAIGSQTLYSNEYSNNTVAVGKQALYMAEQCDENVALGSESMYNLGNGGTSSCGGNIAVGYRSLNGDVNTIRSVVLGSKAIETGGSTDSVAIGYQAMNNVGDNVIYSIAIGSNAMINADGDYSIGIGYSALSKNEGNKNIGIGSSALVNNTTGASNIAIGYNVLGANVGGGKNVAIGDEAGVGVLGSSNIFLGYRAGYNFGSTDNKLIIENSSNITTPLIYGDFSTNILNFSAKVGINDPTPQETLEVRDDTAGISRIRITDEGVSDNPELQLQYGSDNTYDHWSMYVNKADSESFNIWGEDAGGASGDVRLNIQKTGQIGINTVSPSTGADGPLYLDVEGNVGAQKYCDENGDDCFEASEVGTGSGLWHESGSDIYYGLLADGEDNVGIGINNPSEKLDVNGNIKALALGIGGVAPTADRTIYASKSYGGNGNSYSIDARSTISDEKLSAPATKYGLYHLMNSGQSDLNGNTYTVYGVESIVRNGQTSGADANATTMVGGRFTSLNQAVGNVTNNYGSQSMAQNLNAGSVTGTLRGSSNIADINAGTVTNAYASYNLVDIDGGNTTNVYVSYNYASINTADITTLYGDYTRLQANTGGTVGSGYLYRGTYIDGGGTYSGTKFGLYLENETANYLSGKLGVGVNPSAKFQVYTASTDNIDAAYIDAGGDAAGEDGLVVLAQNGTSFSGDVIKASANREANSGFNLISTVIDADGGTPSYPFTVRGDGNVGINDPAPNSKLTINMGDIEDTEGLHITRLAAADHYAYLNIEGEGGLSEPIFKVHENGSVVVGDSAPSSDLKLDVEGKVGATYYCDQDGSVCKTIAQLVNGVNYWTKEANDELHYIANGVGIGVGATNPSDYAALEVYGHVSQLGLNQSTYFGYNAGLNHSASSHSNVGMGYEALSLAGSVPPNGYSNTAVGYQALKNGVGSFNVAVGTSALGSNSQGEGNVAIGSTALEDNVDGSSNVAVGEQTLSANLGSDNTVIGQRAEGSNVNGSGNVSIGYWAGSGGTIANPQGSKFNNVIIGNSAGYGLGGAVGSTDTDCYGNVLIGYQSGYNDSGSLRQTQRNIFIGYQAGYNQAGSNLLFIENSNSATPLIWGDFSANRVVINGNATNNFNNRTFFSNGSAGGTTAWYNDSDERLKKNINTIESPLDKVLQLRGVNYEWKDTENHEEGEQIGFIAQEVSEILPEVVDKSGDYYSMQYAPITALLVEAMKEQQKLIEDLENEIEKLKKEHYNEE